MKYFSTQAMFLGHASVISKAAPTATGAWTVIKHTRFLAAIDLFPQGPWKTIAKDIGTRTPRQTKTHAQKYREKLFRQSKMPKLPTRKVKSAMGDVSKVKTHVELLQAIPTQVEIVVDGPSDQVVSMDEAMHFLVHLVGFRRFD
ncbi:hypothetical protein DYB25_007141 [Aphanomyces astaci]|uniref:HTH myb-type domain-containing protein n=1 Tax=Aphanomyces astaci TaxID=112090 RepID=A0A397DJK6_APHAT|nr:hypothetical protein DYB36_005789 [Aphanomyces astaci]RHY07553.1 hypothetical protein DYB25_007141 [Aphanomyces astaci]RHY40757.1 hypothetical protein DYB30_007872 [Aphanomyces astaci]RHY66029.1 hypothetical protein DYB38_006895 [Aphanomyces astaci]RHY66119.1 hypothetical protein DYB34_006998 [Aphanomyces astaci]